jgi:hypothetical protein
MLHILAALERGHEAHFALHQELVYKVFARRNQVFAEWVAGLMGRRGEGVSAYVKEMHDHVFGDADAGRLLEKARTDLVRCGVVMPEGRLESKLYEVEGRACHDVLEAIVGHPVVPHAKLTKFGLGSGVRAVAAGGLHAIEAALARAKDPAPPLRFCDIFLSLVGTRPAAPAE